VTGPDDRLARAALASAAIPNRLAHASRAGISGFWLGLLSENALRALDERYYSQTGVYRTTDWNERGLFDWERDLIEAHFQPGTRILVAACGGGREVLALVQAGFDAVGYEPHEELASYGSAFLAERGYPGRIHPAPRDELPAEAGTDGVVVGWGGYSLIHGRDRRIALLAAVAERLPHGRPVLMSFFHRQADTRELRMTRSIANGLRRLAGRERIELGETLAPNRVRIFTRAQLEAELRDAGLELIEHRVVGQADEGISYAAAVARVG
jgi:SAM-dependent methyltransferase